MLQTVPFKKAKYEKGWRTAACVTKDARQSGVLQPASQTTHERHISWWADLPWQL